MVVVLLGGTLYVFHGESRAQGHYFPRGPGVSSSPAFLASPLSSFPRCSTHSAHTHWTMWEVPSWGTLSTGHPRLLSLHFLIFTPDKSILAVTKGLPRCLAQKETKSPPLLTPSTPIAQRLIGKLSASPRQPVCRPWNHTTPRIMSGSGSVACHLKSSCGWGTLRSFL